VSDWQIVEIKGTSYLFCVSNDSVDGILMTAHIGDIFKLFTVREFCEARLIIANTCIWKRSSNKELLRRVQSTNPNAELYFAKQELSVDQDFVFRHSNTIADVGQFGFQTSLSERQLFRNRGRGLEPALKEAFDRVSPIVLASDLLIGE
jgi:hypothetical protein